MCLCITCCFLCLCRFWTSCTSAAPPHQEASFLKEPPVHHQSLLRCCLCHFLICCRISGCPVHTCTVLGIVTDCSFVHLQEMLMCFRSQQTQPRHALAELSTWPLCPSCLLQLWLLLLCLHCKCCQEAEHKYAMQFEAF
jgi:hypothetical protein